MVELDPQRAARVVDRQGPEQRVVLDPEVLERTQRLAGRPAQLGVVALRLQLGQHHEGDDHLVLLETDE